LLVFVEGLVKALEHFLKEKLEWLRKGVPSPGGSENDINTKFKNHCSILWEHG
jgi:hypothetical protein